MTLFHWNQKCNPFILLMMLQKSCTWDVQKKPRVIFKTANLPRLVTPGFLNHQPIYFLDMSLLQRPSSFLGGNGILPETNLSWPSKIEHNLKKYIYIHTSTSSLSKKISLPFSMVKHISPSRFVPFSFNETKKPLTKPYMMTPMAQTSTWSSSFGDDEGFLCHSISPVCLRTINGCFWLP